MKKRIKSFALIDIHYNKKARGYTNWPLLTIFFFSCLVLLALVK